MNDAGPTSVAPPGNILVVEDNAVSGRVAEALLRELGFQADVVVDGGEAVKAAALTPYRAILMDCQIPVLDGFQATREIRRHEGVLRRTPIIAVTSPGVGTNRAQCMAAGMDDYLAKPLRSLSLAALLTRWVPDGSVPSSTLDPAPPRERQHAPVVAAVDQVLDPEVVIRLERLSATSGEDLVGQLAVLFAADADSRVAAMRNALAAETSAALFQEAHALSGASVNVGATHLARLCDTLTTDPATDLDASALCRGWAIVEAIEVEIGRVRSALGLLRPRP